MKKFSIVSILILLLVCIFSNLSFATEDIQEIVQAKNSIEKLIKNRKFDTALTDAENIIKKYPNNYLSLYLWGLANHNKFNYDIALDAYNKSIELNSNFQPVYIYLGLIYIEKKDYQKATKIYDKAIEVSVTDEEKSSSYINKAHAEFKIFFKKGLETNIFDEEISYYYFKKAFDLDDNYDKVPTIGGYGWDFFSYMNEYFALYDNPAYPEDVKAFAKKNNCTKVKYEYLWSIHIFREYYTVFSCRIDKEFHYIFRHKGKVRFRRWYEKRKFNKTLYW